MSEYSEAIQALLQLIENEPDMSEARFDMLSSRIQELEALEPAQVE